MANLDNKHNMSEHTFIANSGASSHMCYTKTGLHDLKEYRTEITVGNSEAIFSEAIGTYKGTVLQQDGTYMDIVLKDVLYIPDLWLNLLSLTKAIKNPNVQLSSKNSLITLDINGNGKITFDKVYNSGSGQILGVDIAPHQEKANVMHPTERNKNISHKDLHEKLGHPNDQVLKATAKCFEFNVTGEPLTCTSCAISKQKKKQIPKESNNKATQKLERIGIDLSYTTHTSYGGAKYWLLIQDEFTSHVWSYFLKTKDELAETTTKWIKQIEKEHDIKIQNIRCDNAGENKALQKRINEDEKLKIKFEFTAPHTPEQNEKVEQKFATLYGKVRSMLNWARLTENMRNGLWAQCALLATQLENILYKPGNKKSASELFYGKNPTWIQNLNFFGEIGIVHDGQNAKIRGKLSDRGIECMFIGYSDDHAANVYKFFNLNKQSVIMSRNVIWLKQNYGDYRKIKEEDIHKWIPDLELKEEDSEDNEFEDDEEEEEGIVNVIPQGRRVPREIRNLATFYNPDPGEENEPEEEGNLERALLARVFSPEASMVANIQDGSPEPKTYIEAKASKDWKHWWDAICLEFDNMEENKVWKIIKKTDLPAGRKIIGNRWVFAQKDDGRYRTRTVAKGFSQVPGKDFVENHAPVVNDTTFHLVLALKVLFKLEAGQFDIETAFLYGELEEDLWMQMPEV